MCLIQSKHAQIKFPLSGFSTVHLVSLFIVHLPFASIGTEHCSPYCRAHHIRKETFLYQVRCLQTFIESYASVQIDNYEMMNYQTKGYNGGGKKYHASVSEAWYSGEHSCLPSS